jgi:hypothetical protein
MAGGESSGAKTAFSLRSNEKAQPIHRREAAWRNHPR